MAPLRPCPPLATTGFHCLADSRLQSPLEDRPAIEHLRPLRTTLTKTTKTLMKQEPLREGLADMPLRQGECPERKCRRKTCPD